MSSFRVHEENYHRASQAINRHINGLQLKKVEALAAIDLPAELEEAEQYVSIHVRCVRAVSQLCNGWRALQAHRGYVTRN